MPGRPLLVLCALLGATSAAAQAYVVTSGSAPYAALSTPIVPVLQGTTPSDNGYAVVPIGFEFPYFGTTYETITVTADGAAFFEPNPASSSYPTNTVLPSGAPPHGVLAPFWDNLEGSNPTSRLGYQNGSGPNGQTLTIEWLDWNHWSGSATYQLRFQLRLHENGLIEMHHGTFTGAGQVLSATVGIEDPLGTVGVAAKACTPNCAASDITANQLFTFGPGPNTTDLLAGKLVVDSVTESSGVLTIATRFDVRNFGTVAASGIDYALYLSPDTKLDATDTPLAPTTQGPISVGGMGKVTHSATSTVPKPPSGAWFVLAVIDPSNAIAETSEANNVGHLAAPLVSGVDLVAHEITSSTPSSGPGSPVTNTISFANPGIDGAGTVQWRVLLSSDTKLDVGDYVVHQGSTSVSGGQSVLEQITYNLPGNVPDGSYWFLLQLDPSNALAELSEANNLVVSDDFLIVKQADLAASAFQVLDPLPPWTPANQSFLGEPFRVHVPVSNLGGATAQSVMVGVYLSANDTLSALNDQLVGDTVLSSLAPTTSVDVVVTGTIPSTTTTGAPLQPGRFHLFVVVTSNGVDPNPANNVVRFGPHLIIEPGPDLTAGPPKTQATIAAGELIPVMRVLRNAGNRAAPSTAYRFCLSKNGIVTEQDPVLPIVLADGSVAQEGAVILGAHQGESRTEWVRVPEGTAPGDYFISVLMDPAEAIAEIDELNNGVPGDRVTVVPGALEVVPSTVPDALLGVPFVYRVAVSGGVAPLQYELVAPGMLPDGLSLDPTTGFIAGHPTTVGVVPFSIRIADATGRSVTSTLVLRVVESTTAVTVTSTRLPAPVMGTAYSATLSAQGGSMPYRWAVVAGALPPGLELSEDGSVTGSPSGPVGAPSEFDVRVLDAHGNADVERFSLTVIPPGGIYIETRAFPEAQLGVDFATDVVAKSANNEPLEQPVTWTVVRGGPPPGMGFEPGGEQVWILRGIPQQAGAFPMSIEVRDGQGRSYTGELILTVHRAVARIVSSVPAAVLPGTELSGGFAFEGDVPGTFAIHSGFLPPGVTLNADGSVTGRVPDDAAYRTYTFTVTGVTANGVEGMTSYSIDVTDELPQAAGGCGCAGGGGGGPIGSLAFGALLWAAATRRRGARQRTSSGSRAA